MPEPTLLTVTEVIANLHCSRATFYSLINSGRLRAVKLGRRTYVTPADLQAFIDSLETFSEAPDEVPA